MGLQFELYPRLPVLDFEYRVEKLLEKKGLAKYSPFGTRPGLRWQGPESGEIDLPELREIAGEYLLSTRIRVEKVHPPDEEFPYIVLVFHVRTVVEGTTLHCADCGTRLEWGVNFDGLRCPKCKPKFRPTPSIRTIGHEVSLTQSFLNEDLADPIFARIVPAWAEEVKA